jgi:regulator of protease activity HflC (stomatin/prohibitin superfamily)
MYLFEFIFGLLILALLAAFFWARKNVWITIIYDYEKGLRYRNGQFLGVVNEGRYFSIRPFSSIERIDMRKTTLFVPAQEVFTKDKIFVKITLGGQYRIVDPIKARHLSAHSDTELYSRVQMILRDEMASFDLDEFLEKRKEVADRIEKIIQSTTEKLGLEVESIIIKDVIVPASIRKAYAGIIEAKKEAQKKLEQARGEQAVLRNLANSSAMYDKNPMLFQARLIQALSSGTNMIVFKAGEGLSLPHETTFLQK